MRRVMSLWLPSWPTDGLRRASGASAEKPFVPAISVGSRRLVAASGAAASSCGIMPGLPLADAQAYCPGLVIFESDPGGDAAALRRLAEWCDRWSPWTAPDGIDGVIIDITGCAHLSGGSQRSSASPDAVCGFAETARGAGRPRLCGADGDAGGSRAGLVLSDR